MSVGELFIRGNAIWGTVLPGDVCLENCPFGELSAGQMSSGNCLSGKCPSKKVRVGKVRRKTVLQPANVATGTELERREYRNQTVLTLPVINLFSICIGFGIP